MEEWAKKAFIEEKKKRKVPLELKKIRGNYYLCRVSSVWDSKRGRARKISGEYLGRMTKQGLVAAGIKRNVRSVFEYGNARLLYNMAEEIIPLLKEAFQREWKEIIAMAIVKVIRDTPIKMVKSVWEKTYLCNEIEAALSPNTLSEKLRNVGSDWSSQSEFFRKLMRKSEYLLFDMSSIFSRSENLNFAEKGHNPDHLYIRQVNMALFFDEKRKIPVMLKPMPGSIRDVKALRKAVEEAYLPSCVVVMDRGFASYDVAELLQENKMRFILPLRRNFKAADYDLQLKDAFVFRKRGIKWARYSFNGKFIYMYEDVILRAEEETTKIALKEEENPKRLDERRFGKIAILSNLDMNGKKLFLLWKEREDVEQAFDALKNELEIDKAYLREDDGLMGYFFVSFISLYLYHRVLDILRKKDVISDMSVKELLFELSKSYLIKYGDGRTRFSETPRKIEELDGKLGLNILPN